MIKILDSVFANYGIEKVLLVEEENCYNFIISGMKDSISIERWDYLEHVLKDIIGKDINLIPYNQAIKCFDKDYVSKGKVIR